MSENDIWIAAAVVFAAVSALAAVSAFGYYSHLIRRMSRMLRRYQDGVQMQEQEKIAETRESKLEAQLRRILRQSAAQQREAKKDRESLAGLLSDLSHQLKTPLANIAMDAELLQEQNLTSEEQRRFSGHIAEQAAKMQWLVSALVKSSRLEHGIVQFEAAPQGIRQTLARSVSAVFMQAQEKKIAIELEKFEDRKLYHNRKWTTEALGNILENAVKYSPMDSTVRIRVQPLELYTRIDVCDEGPGVAPEECNEIFKRFYRSSALTEAEGTGLGLYLAQMILVKEKGYITCSGNPEGGSCFSVFLLNERPEGSF